MIEEFEQVAFVVFSGDICRHKASENQIGRRGKQSACVLCFPVGIDNVRLHLRYILPAVQVFGQLLNDGIAKSHVTVHYQMIISIFGDRFANGNVVPGAISAVFAGYVCHIFVLRAKFLDAFFAGVVNDVYPKAPLSINVILSGIVILVIDVHP